MSKVLFFMCNLNVGGAEKALVDVINNLDHSKYSITLLLLSKEGMYLDKINENIQVKYINDSSNLIKFKIFNKINYLFIKYLPKLFYKLHIDEKYDVEIGFMEGIPMKFISNSNNKHSKKITWVHCDLMNHHWTKKIFNSGEEEQCYNKMDEIVFVSNGAKESFNKLFNINDVNQSIVYNPIIERDIIDKSNEKINTFDKFTIISVGRLDYQKGYDRLIKAHSKLVKKYPHNLVIIGEGQERLTLEQMIKELHVEDTVHLLGYKENPYAYIKNSDIYVCSSRSEGYSISVAEAVVLKKLIICTDIEGPKEILQNGKYGIICDNSESGIEEALERVFEDESIKYKYFTKLQHDIPSFNHNKVISEIEGKLINKKHTA